MASFDRFDDDTRMWLRFGACLLAFSVVRCLQLTYAGWGTGNDVYLYLRYASDWGRGAAPYVDFHPEYPPGALLAFIGPLLAFGRDEYVRGFAVEMACFDFVALWLVVAWTRRMLPDQPRAAALTGASYLLASAALFPVIYARFDLVPGVLVLAALYFTYTPGRWWLGALLLGVAGGVKLWPFALYPLWALLAWRRGGARGLVLTSVHVAIGMVLPALPSLPRAEERVLDFLSFHVARGIQIESTWSTVALILNALNIAPATPVHEYGAFHVSGPVAVWFNRLSVPALLALALAPQVVAFRGALGREGDAQGRIGLCATLAAVLGFMVGGKVLSPQYLLWIVPLVPAFVLVEGRAAQRGLLAAATLTAMGLTSLVYPYWSPALEQREPGHGAALLAVGARNLLLMALYVIALQKARVATIIRAPSAAESSS